MLVFHLRGIYPLFVEDILREIDAALERRGISARAASMRAQGAPEMIRDMRRGHVPSVERLRSLCEVLGLEFYVGPPRWRRTEDGGALPDVPLRALERSARDLVRLTLDAGGDPIPDELRPALAARRVIEPPDAKEKPPAEGRHVVEMKLDTDTLSLYENFMPWPFNDPRNVPPDRHLGPQLSQTQRSLVGRFIPEPLPDDDSGTAGDRRDRAGSDHGAPDERGDHPAQWVIVEIEDESMAPTLPKGCVTMVDSKGTDWDSSCITVVERGDDVVFRRVSTDHQGRRLLVCDHPDWPDEPWPADAQIIGHVKWVGHWLD